MIPKVVGYAGFQSYSQVPYSSLKPGQTTLDTNEKWKKSNYYLISCSIKR